MTLLALRLPGGPSVRAPDSSNPSPWLVLLFGISVFVVLTLFAKLNPTTDVHILNDKRAFATGLGALVYWLTLRSIVARSDRTLREMILAALAVGVPGTAMILVAREMFDLFTSPDGSEGMARNVRWLLIWSGYYGAWVAGFVAVRFHRCATAREAAINAAITPAAVRSPNDESAHDWLIDAIADELAAQPGVDRQALSRRLLARAGYEQADSALDPEAPRGRARRDLALRVATRLRRRA